MTHKLLKRALVVLLSVVSISIDAQEKPVLWYDKPAQYWEEALPLGDGRLGEGVSKCTPSVFNAQSPDFHKLGLCYYLKTLYL